MQLGSRIQFWSHLPAAIATREISTTYIDFPLRLAAPGGLTSGSATHFYLYTFCIRGPMLIFCSSFLVGLLYDFQILHIDAQIFQLGSHDVLKIQVY